MTLYWTYNEMNGGTQLKYFLATKYNKDGKIVVERFHLPAYNLVHATEQFEARFGELEPGERLELTRTE